MQTPGLNPWEVVRDGSILAGALALLMLFLKFIVPMMKPSSGDSREDFRFQEEVRLRLSEIERVLLDHHRHVEGAIKLLEHINGEGADCEEVRQRLIAIERLLIDHDHRVEAAIRQLDKLGGRAG